MEAKAAASVKSRNADPTRPITQQQIDDELQRWGYKIKPKATTQGPSIDEQREAFRQRMERAINASAPGQPAYTPEEIERNVNAAFPQQAMQQPAISKPQWQIGEINPQTGYQWNGRGWQMYQSEYGPIPRQQVFPGQKQQVQLEPASQTYYASATTQDRLNRAKWLHDQMKMMQDANPSPFEQWTQKEKDRFMTLYNEANQHQQRMGGGES